MSKQRKTTQRNKMPGLRLSRGIWQIEKRCKYSESGWLRESTGTSSRSEAESYLIKRLAQLEEQFHRKKDKSSITGGSASGPPWLGRLGSLLPNLQLIPAVVLGAQLA